MTPGLAAVLGLILGFATGVLTMAVYALWAIHRTSRGRHRHPAKVLRGAR